MNWNPYKHIRLAGAVTCIVGAIMGNVMLSFIGLMIVASGVIGAVDRIERIMDTLTKKEDDDASN